ncbi:MAG: hypothetical protein JSR54_12905 [Proteobacteria bacterium]|nr:hypothetical protein [Pseudomonadota bacterium]
MPAPSFRSIARPLAVGLLLASTAAAARPPVEEPDNLLNDSLTLQAGLVSSSNHTTVRYDSAAGTPGTVIDGEKDLGLPSRKLAGRAELMFRMKKRHRVHIGNYYLPLDRRATVPLEKTINFGNSTYNVGDIVASSLKVRLLAINYTYDFVKTDRVELGASLGFDVIGFEASATVAARLRSETQDHSAPAPLAGLDGTVRLSSRFYGEARAQYVRANVQEVHGSLQTYEANLLYRLNPNVTFGLGYSGFKVNVDSQKATDGGQFAMRSNGPQLFARVGF